MIRTPLRKLLMLGALSGSPAVEDIATGNPLAFQTDLARPLKSLLIPFTPQQSGTGAPSPSNIRPILPWNGLTVRNTGKNLLPLVSVHALPNGNDSNSYGTSVSVSDGIVTITQSQTTTDYEVRNYRNGYFVIRFDGFRNLLAKTKMRFSAKINITSNPLNTDCLYFAPNGIVDVEAPINNGIVSGIVNQKFDGTKDYLEIRCSGCSFTMTDIMLYPYSETDPTFEPYEGHETDIVFPSPVYGGTLDVVSGVLTVQRVSISKKWSEWEAQSVGNTHTRKTFLFNDPVKGASMYAWSRCNVAPQDWNTSQNTHFYIDENKAYVWLPNETDGDLVVQVAGVLVTTQEITLTPEQITALKGENTIWSDANGEMTATYLKKG